MDNHLRIAQITDVHLGSTFDGDTFSSYMKDISKRNVDLLCVTGDFVDDETKRKDMVKACKALGEFKSTYGVYFVFGNHEVGYYPKYRDFDTADLIDELKLNNVTILEDQVIEIGDFYLIGRKDLSNPTRLSIDELIEGLDDKYKIVLNHQPNDYDSEKGKVDLVLSGHTHGGNVFPINFLINMLNDQTYGIKKLNNTNFIVSSGISCWALPFNNVTIQEYVIIDIN